MAAEKSTWAQVVAQTLWFSVTCVHIVLSYAYFLFTLSRAVLPSKTLTEDTHGWSRVLYRYAMVASIAAYTIVLYSSFGRPRFNEAYLRKILFSDNFYYLLLACYHAVSAVPFFFLMVPFTTYAVFHTTNTVSRFVLPKVSHEGLRSHIQSVLRILDRNQTWILQRMPYYEVGAAVWLLLLTLLGRGHLVTFVVYYMWLRARSRGSSTFQPMIIKVQTALQRMVQSPACPKFVRNAYHRVQQQQSAQKGTEEKKAS